MDYIKFKMVAGKDMVESLMEKEQAEQLIATAKEKKIYNEGVHYYIKIDDKYIFGIKKPGKGKDVILQ